MLCSFPCLTYVNPALGLLSGWREMPSHYLHTCVSSKSNSYCSAKPFWVWGCERNHYSFGRGKQKARKFALGEDFGSVLISWEFGVYWFYSLFLKQSFSIICLSSEFWWSRSIRRIFQVRSVILLPKHSVSDSGSIRCFLWDHKTLAISCSWFPLCHSHSITESLPHVPASTLVYWGLLGIMSLPCSFWIYPCTSINLSTLVWTCWYHVLS